MTPDEAVILDWLMERGYTREQAARALVALMLPSGGAFLEHLQVARSASFGPDGLEAGWLQAEAERRGYLPKP